MSAKRSLITASVLLFATQALMAQNAPRGMGGRFGSRLSNRERSERGQMIVIEKDRVVMPEPLTENQKKVVAAQKKRYEDAIELQRKRDLARQQAAVQEAMGKRGGPVLGNQDALLSTRLEIQRINRNIENIDRIFSGRMPR